MKNLILFSIFSTSLANAGVCTDADKKSFDTIVANTDNYCVGVLNPSNKNASDGIDGDIIWKQAGKEVRVGSAVDRVVVVPSGVLMVGYTGSKAAVHYWDLATKKTKKCSEDVSARDVMQGITGFDLGTDFIRVRGKTTSKTYFANCSDNGEMTVFAELTKADRAVLEQFKDSNVKSNDLTDPEVYPTLNEIMGRDEITRQVIATISAREKRSSLLWGPAGVGKTAIAERLAQMIVRKEVPEWLNGWSVYMISLGKMGEEGVKGLAEKKMQSIIAAASGKKCILVMDEIHQLIGLGTGKDDNTDVTEVMKTNLANGQLAVIGTLTDSSNEMPLLRTKDAFFSRFNKIQVGEPDPSVLLAIYKNRAKKETKRYGIEFPEEILKQLLALTKRYMPTENNPRIGIGVIETVAANLSLKGVEKGYKVTLQDIRNQVGSMSNNKQLMNTGSEKEGGRSFKEIVKAFKNEMGQKYIGNETAVDAIHRSLLITAAGNAKPTRPAGIFLFLGPSGVGKTYLAELTAQHFGMKSKLWGMNQYKAEHSLQSFLGAPPSYVGYKEGGGELTQFINNNPSSVLIFDEADKGHPDILQSFITLMDTGKIKDNSGIEANFTNGFLFFTSNFAMDMINAYDTEVLKIVDETQGAYSEKYKGYIPKDEDELKTEILNRLQTEGAFGTYFAGRIGFENIIIFHHHNPENSAKIAKLEIKSVIKEMDANYKVEVDKSVFDYIIANGFSFHYGARKVRDMAKSLIAYPVSQKVVELEDGTFSGVKVSLTLDKKNKPVVNVEVMK
jgi:ATP-dependent Clp protease ATP-binding subunit ClpA